jgi:hypothetical protein
MLGCWLSEEPLGAGRREERGTVWLYENGGADWWEWNAWLCCGVLSREPRGR